MKKVFFALIIFLQTGLLIAQVPEDALRLSLNRTSGTARSLSLSNAMGALGGDLSSIGINPAGIAVYRSSEFTFTPSLNINTVNSSYYGTSGDDEKLSFPLQQIGFVGTYKPMREVTSGLVSTHFAVGYERSNSFNRRSFIQGNGVNSSLLDEIVWLSDGYSPADLNYNSSRLRLFYDSFLIDPFNEDVYDDNSIKTDYYHAFEELNEEGDAVWTLQDGIDQRRMISERGSAGDLSIAGGANFSNKFYIGGSLGISTHNYKRDINHFESVNPGAGNNHWNYLNNYSYEDKYSTSAVGVNLKVGAIFKPINPLRLGVSVHSPTLLSVDEEYSYAIEPELDFAEDDYYWTPRGEFSYNFRTPYKLTGSVAYIFGNFGLLSVDYEFTDYAAMRFKDKSTNSVSNVEFFSDLNDQVKDIFRPTHNIRVGAEIRPAEVFTIRGGFGYFQSPFRSKYLNHDDSHFTYSGGLGFRMNNMFIDLAYMMRAEKNTYSLYYSAYVAGEDQQPASLKTNNHNVAVTLGWRF